MSEFGELIDSDTVRFVRLLPGPIERVWHYLTDADRRGLWLCSGETEQRVGGHVDLHFHNAGLSDQPDIPVPEKYSTMPEHVHFTGTVTECEPPHRLSHTWEFENENSEVTYELSEEGAGVRLTLTHRRLRSRDELISVCGGWHTHLAILDAVLTEQTPPPFWKTHAGMEAEYEKRLPQ